MKICVVGAGAIGGLIGTRLALVGHDVSALARGATLEALRKHGWRLREDDQLRIAPVRASDRTTELGSQDLVVIAVKGQSLPDVATQLQPLLESDTLVLPAMNGIPWWFGRGVPLLGDAPLGCVDPHGSVSRSIPLEQVIACAVYAGASTLEPGLVELGVGRKLTIGEPIGGTSKRLENLGDVLTRAGFDVTLSGNMRRDIWSKLSINLTVNPISAVTGALTDRLLDDPLVREFCHAAMREASAVGALIGCATEQAPEDRLSMMRKLSRIKPSMLQDVEAGRMLELDALVGALREIAQRIGVATPNVDALLGITRLFARTRGLYPA